MPQGAGSVGEWLPKSPGKTTGPAGDAAFRGMALLSQHSSTFPGLRCNGRCFLAGGRGCALGLPA